LMDIAYQLRHNTYMGRTTLQLNLKDIRPASAKSGS